MGRDCAQHTERLSEYLDGRLHGEQKAALEAHLHDCAECAAELESLRRTAEVVRDLPHRKPAEGFAGRVKARIREEGAAGPASAASASDGRKPGPRILSFRSLLVRRILPVAAMFLVVLGLTFGVARLSRDRGEATVDALQLAKEIAEPPSGQPVGERSDGRQPVVARVGSDVDTPAPERFRTATPMAPAPSLKAGGRGAHLEEVADAIVAAPQAASEAETVPVAEEDRSGLAGNIDSDAYSHLAMAGEEEPIMFVQAPAREAAAPRLAPQQVLTLSSREPTEMAQRAVTVANSRGLPASLALHGGKDAGMVDVYLNVPRDRYELVLADLSDLGGPRDQMLSNTSLARGEFFDETVEYYARRLKARGVRSETNLFGGAAGRMEQAAEGRENGRLPREPRPRAKGPAVVAESEGHAAGGAAVGLPARMAANAAAEADSPRSARGRPLDEEGGALRDLRSVSEHALSLEQEEPESRQHRRTALGRTGEVLDKQEVSGAGGLAEPTARTDPGLGHVLLQVRIMRPRPAGEGIPASE